MIVVIFEVVLKAGKTQNYLDAAATLRPLLEQIDGFISIERFQSLSESGKLLALSYWRDEEAVLVWRNLEKHRSVQNLGRNHLFEDYRLCVATVVRDYGMNARDQAPSDSRRVHL